MPDLLLVLLAFLAGYLVARVRRRFRRPPHRPPPRPRVATSLGLYAAIFAPAPALGRFGDTVMDMKFTDFASLAITPRDAAGNPADVTDIGWAAYVKDSTERTGTIELSPSGLSAAFRPDKTGIVTIHVSATNGAGEVLMDTLDLVVTAGVAVTLGLTAEVKQAA